MTEKLFPPTGGSTAKRLHYARKTNEVLTPQDIAKLRHDVLRRVKDRMGDVAEVLEGKQKWSNQQVRLFGILLNKVMPDLHHSFVEGEIDLTTKKATQLTREQLEQIAARAITIDHEEVSAEDAEDPTEPIDPNLTLPEDDRPA